MKLRRYLSNYKVFVDKFSSVPIITFYLKSSFKYGISSALDLYKNSSIKDRLMNNYNFQTFTQIPSIYQ